MSKTRFAYLVTINKDSVPGWNHQPEDVKEYLRRHLENISHYEPTVIHIDTMIEEPTEDE